MNEKVDILIGTRRLTVEMEGLTPMEISALAQQVSDRMTEIHKAHKNIADTSKVALLVALTFAADYEKERVAHDTTKRMLENSAEKLSQSLRESLQAGGPPVAE